MTYGRSVPMTNEPPHHPFQDLLGFTTTQEEGQGTATIEIRDDHLNPNGVVHGAVAYALIDTAMGAATMSVVPDGGFCATIEVHVRYFRPTGGPTLHATATVRRAGKRIVHLDASVVDGEGTEVAAASGSYAVILP